MPTFDERPVPTPARQKLIGDDYWETVRSLIDCIRELKAEPGNQEILDEALGAAEGARTLAYEMPD